MDEDEEEEEAPKEDSDQEAKAKKREKKRRKRWALHFQSSHVDEKYGLCTDRMDSDVSVTRRRILPWMRKITICSRRRIGATVVPLNLYVLAHLL